MLRRTLTALTPALFALPFLLTPTSQLYADADVMNSVYSGLECKYLDSYAMEGQMMAGGDVVYHTRLGIGNHAPRTRDEANPETDDTRQYRMTVGCPLPSLDPGTKVVVAAIDGTVFDDVTCRVQSCLAGLGLGEGGEGMCKDSTSASSHADQAGFVDDTETSPVTQKMNYITQNVTWLELEAPDVPFNENAGARNEDPESGDGDDGLGARYTHLLCTLPEQDDVSPTAPAIRDADGMPLSEEGISYIQSYYVQ